MIRAVMDGLLAVLLAPECAACRAPLIHPTQGCVCESCWLSIPRIGGPVCRLCGEALREGVPALMPASCDRCTGVGSAIDSVRSAALHTGAMRAVVHALKYDGRRSIAKPLAELMRTAAPEMLRDAAAAVPVPLHPARRRARGFNQAYDLARHLQLPVIQALRRTRATRTQTALPADERRANVAGAFAGTRHAVTLRGLVVVLVDDVRTTGATLEACATVLKEAGVREVRALTAARVETPPG